MSDKECSLLRLPFWQSLPLPLGKVSLSKPLTGLLDLDNINPLLESHDRKGNDGQDPGDGTIHLVGTKKRSVLGSVNRAKSLVEGQTYRAISIAPAEKELLNSADG